MANTKQNGSETLYCTEQLWCLYENGSPVAVAYTPQRLLSTRHNHYWLARISGKPEPEFVIKLVHDVESTGLQVPESEEYPLSLCRSFGQMLTVEQMVDFMAQQGETVQV